MTTLGPAAQWHNARPVERPEARMLNEQQTLITDTARRFVREQIVEPRLDRALDRSAEFPHDILRALWEQGLVNLEFPEAVGGQGL